MVHDMLQTMFERFTADNSFTFSRTTFFTQFGRRELPHVKNKTLTLQSKFIIKYTWDCRNRSHVPNQERCFDSICDTILENRKYNRNFNKVWENSGLLEPPFRNVIP